MERTVQKNRIRAAVEFLVVGLCTVAFALNAAGIGATLLTDNFAGARDFVTYWSSGQQLAHHANPYDRDAILSLEHSVGYSLSTAPLIMRNPPPSLLLVLPLGFFGIRAASWLWTLLMLASLVLSVQIIASMHDRRKSQLNWLAYTFAPVLSCLIAGQMALFVLLGLVLFLRFQATRPLLAGSALWLCALKPHLFLPFAAVLLVWIVAEKRYKILLGAALAFFASALVIFIIDPSAWAQYGFMMRAAKLDIAIIPCISMAIRLLVNPHAIWIQYFPAALGCLWALSYFRDRWRSWDWLEHGSLLMLVSVVVAPYSWFMDQVVLLPALLHALYQNRSRTLVAVFALLSAVVEIANFRGVPLGYWPLYSVTAPAWLAWYLWTRYQAKDSGRPAADGLVPSADPRATERRMRVQRVISQFKFHVWMGCASIVILCFAVIASLVTHTRLTLGDPLIALFVVLAGLLPLPLYFHKEQRIDKREAALVILWALVLAIVLPSCVGVAARADLPLRDATFVRVDDALGITAPHMLVWGRDHWLGRMITRTYPWLIPLLPLSIFAPALAGNWKDARLFLVGNIVASAIGLAGFALFPAIGPWYGYHYIGGTEQMQCQADLFLLRIPGPYAGHAAGIVCFPSFHVIWAILCARALWGFRLLRIPIAVLSGMIVLSTMTTGWHYFCDVLAGACIAVLSLFVAEFVNARTMLVARENP